MGRVGRYRLVIWVISFIMGLVVFLGWALLQEKEARPTSLIGRSVPSFQLPSLGDPHEVLTEKRLIGHPALVNIWATWCHSCAQEHGFLNELAARQQIPLYGIDYQDDREAALARLKSAGDPYTAHFYDERGQVGILWGVYGTPETFLIDGAGIVRYRHVGPLNQVVWEREFLPRIQAMEA